jgi:uncharacterized membrane protein YkgB
LNIGFDREAKMFEKRLQAFSYAVGTTFLILVLLILLTFTVYSLMLRGVLGGIWPFCTVKVADMARYLLNLKLMGVFFGAVFLVCYFWLKGLKKLS